MPACWTAGTCPTWTSRPSAARGMWRPVTIFSISGSMTSRQLAMQSQLKLFYRPKAIIRSSNDQPERKLTAERNAGHLTLRNPTPYYITVAWLGADRSHRLSGFREGVMVPPLGSLPLKAVLPAETRTLWVGYIDDYGGLQMNRYACDALNCAFKDAGATS